MDDIHRLIAEGTACASAGADARLAAVAAALSHHPEQAVADDLEQRVLDVIGSAWARGWLPTELVRHLRRRDETAGDLAALAVAADLARHDVRAVHPRWRASCDEVTPEPTEPSGWLREFTWRTPGGWQAAVSAALVACGVTRTLPPLAMLVPPPGGDDLPGRREAAANAAAWMAAVSGDSPHLRRIRQLLAQAESTTFPDEAATFTAKAHELAARLSIDLATHVGATSDRPVIVRFPLDEPYAGQKALLLHAVSAPSGCRAIRHSGLGLCSVIGFASDVLAAEVLFTSLLLQSQSELDQITRAAPPGSRERSRGFRSSFLDGYASTVHDRLASITTTVEREHSPDGRQLPVMVARRQQVDDVVDSTFSVRRARPRSVDATAWVAGRSAADRADLGRDSVGGSRRSLDRPA